MTRPVAVAITGGIGAGKSEALRAFARHGAATVSSDEIVHHLLQRDDVRDARRRAGWVAALRIPRRGTSTGRRSRRSSSTTATRSRWLEELLHPLVAGEYLEWRERLAALENAPRVCVTEVPLLYEVGADERFDRVVLVTAPRKLRDLRTDGRSEGREERLIPDAEKRRRADYVCVNTGSLDELDAFVAGVMRDLVPET